MEIIFFDEYWHVSGVDKNVHKYLREAKWDGTVRAMPLDFFYKMNGFLMFRTAMEKVFDRFLGEHHPTRFMTNSK